MWFFSALVDTSPCLLTIPLMPFATSAARYPVGSGSASMSTTPSLTVELRTSLGDSKHRPYSVLNGKLGNHGYAWYAPSVALAVARFLSDRRIASQMFVSAEAATRIDDIPFGNLSG